MQIFDPIHNNYDTYTALAVRTASPLEGRKELLHALQGIVCENLEIMCLFQPMEDIAEPVLETKLTAEMGDLAWFICLYFWWKTEHSVVETEALFEHVFASVFIVTPETFPAMLVSTSEKISALIKKEFAYGKLISDSDADTLVTEAIVLLASLLHYRDLTLELICNANIAKLAKRYNKGTFSVQQAEERNEHAEEKAVASTNVDKHSENATTFFAQSPSTQEGKKDDN